MTGIPAVRLTRHLGGFWLPGAVGGASPPLRAPARAFRVCASPAATFRPSTRMFLAAFTSPSWAAPHCGQVHDLTSRGLLPEQNPHTEHSRLDGNQRLTLTTDRPRRSAFSSTSRTSVAQPASWTDFASRVRVSRTRPGPAHRSLGYHQPCGGPACDVRPGGPRQPYDAGQQPDLPPWHPPPTPSPWRPVPSAAGQMPGPCGAAARGCR